MIQVQHPGGHWRSVVLPSGHVAILPGYTLERATCGLVKATTHSVVSMSINPSFSDLWTCIKHTTVPASYRVVTQSTKLVTLNSHAFPMSVVRP